MAKNGDKKRQHWDKAPSQRLKQRDAERKQKQEQRKKEEEQYKRKDAVSTGKC
ncbi:MAG: hypothetical protein ACREXR_18240 [Gammaproteobacteria bacterium]